MRTEGTSGQCVRHRGQPVALEGLDIAGVGESGQSGIDRHPGQQGEIVALGSLLGLAFAEQGDLLPQSGQTT